MLKQFLGQIPWTSATVQVAITGIVGAWIAYLTKVPVGDAPVTLQATIAATLAGLATIYHRRAVEQAGTKETTTP